MSLNPNSQTQVVFLREGVNLPFNDPHFTLKDGKVLVPYLCGAVITGRGLDFTIPDFVDGQATSKCLGFLPLNQILKIESSGGFHFWPPVKPAVAV